MAQSQNLVLRNVETKKAKNAKSLAKKRKMSVSALFREAVEEKLKTIDDWQVEEKEVASVVVPVYLPIEVKEAMETRANKAGQKVTKLYRDAIIKSIGWSPQKGKPADVTVCQITVPEELRDRVNDAAEKIGIDASEIWIKALYEHLDRPTLADSGDTNGAGAFREFAPAPEGENET